MTSAKHVDAAIEGEVASGIYEKHRPLQAGDIVLDIGAHFGHFSMLAAEKVGPKGIIYAIEPNPSNFSKLSDNTQDISNIRKLNVAAWDSEGMFTMYEGLSYTHSMFPFASSVGTVTVKTIDIGEWAMRNRIFPDFVKLDTESSEEKIIHSILKAGLRPEFAIEIHTEKLFADCMTMFKKAGYLFEPKEPTGRRTLSYAWFVPDDTGAL